MHEQDVQTEYIPSFELLEPDIGLRLSLVRRASLSRSSTWRVEVLHWGQKVQTQTCKTRPTGEKCGANWQGTLSRVVVVCWKMHKGKC